MKDKKMTIRPIFALCCCLAFLSLSASARAETPKGVWITVFSEKGVLYSRGAVNTLIEFCKKSGINEIYLQVYRAGKPYYDASFGDRTEYNNILSRAGEDTIDLLLREAEAGNIRVFAWINLMSISKNNNADIITKYGRSVLTKDQYSRSSEKQDRPNESDKYYLRDEQLSLEPGDERVRAYLSDVACDVITRYPKFSGIHLDYARYPNAVPYIPDSRFNQYGLSYGYGDRNVSAFKQARGIDPFNIEGNRASCLLWDNWKRDQVTALIQDIAGSVKRRRPGITVSCAVIPSPERAYSIAFQDWPLWLEMGIINYVVLMDYTTDDRLAEENAISAMAHKGLGKVYIGIGAFLMKDQPLLFRRQYDDILALNPDGIVFFSYDDIGHNMVREKAGP